MLLTPSVRGRCKEESWQALFSVALGSSGLAARAPPHFLAEPLIILVSN